MNSSDHKAYIQSLIAEGEVTLAIKELLNGTRDHQPRLYNDLIPLSGRNARNEKMFNSEKRITLAEYNIGKANIVYALNSYLEKYNPPENFKFPTVEQKVVNNQPLETKPMSQKKTVFLSYNHNDKEWANNIHSMLKDNGIEVIIDQVSTKPGQDLAEFSLESVKAADFTVSLISKNSLYSTWVMLETNDVLNAQRMDGKARFIPVYRDESVFNDEVIEKIQDGLTKKDAELSTKITEGIQKGRMIDHLNDKRNNVKRLNFELPGFIAKLRGMKLIKISDGNFYNGVKEVVNYVKGDS